ncbi:MAG: hypothetical protein HZB56_20645 [Deltaproteobacteria bacterium]|nr:hypothetical protein [Deltaproteobacteria bacterium]
MLARLEALPGVCGARADASGSYLLVDIAAGADAASAEAAVLQALGGKGRRLPDAEAEAQLAGLPHGDPWFSAAEAPGLSYLEARVLSSRVSAEAGRALRLAAVAVERLREATRLELFLAVEQVHREGGRSSSGWFYEAWPRVAARIAERFPGGLPPASPGALGEALRALFPAAADPAGAAPPSARLRRHGEETP